MTRNLLLAARIREVFLDGIINVFKGGDLQIRDKYSFDMLPVNSEENWGGMVDHFTKSAKKFAQHVEELSDDMLDKPFVDVKYESYLRNIEAMIEHGYYHLGQIVMIRKLVEGDFER